ncbi:50S ribosomal protein L23 [Candidatus Wolfebacteria bacterium]|nr:50S ribosomal protein L23 [Candidatus Wolfebacteria bacterium]
MKVLEKKIKSANSSAINRRGSAFLLKQAWITERAGHLVADRKYIFIVEKSANKPEIKKAIEVAYKVKVQDVNIVNVKGKSKRLGRNVGKTSPFKKAIITLKEGQKIDALTP